MSLGTTKLGRLDAIRSHLYAHGPTSVQALAEAIGTSLPTIRRDLLLLAEQGVIDRTHGEARIAQRSGVEIAFGERERHNLAAKRAIAATAYERLAPHSTVFFDAGTTVRQLAKLLRISPIALTVFTNGLLIAQELLDVPKLQVVVIGGQLRNENASMVGPQAEETLERLWFDQLFLGVGSIGPDATIFSVDSAEASLNARMMKRCNSCFAVTDSSKFGVRSTYAVAPLSASTHVITDQGLSRDWRRRLQDIGAPVTLVDPLTGTA
ncbi:MAG: DeoR/GlpR family DNA-binding transcription regulator [Microlunatus sp.]